MHFAIHLLIRIQVFYISTFANTWATSGNNRTGFCNPIGLLPSETMIRSQYPDKIKTGFYWKDHRLQDGTIFGYSKASKAKAIVFSKAFETIRKTK
ncbi:MAG: hypothetical protein R2792_19990 [Saprospiraceae bacterium]